MRREFAVGLGLGLLLVVPNSPAQSEASSGEGLGERLSTGSQLFREERFAEAAAIFSRAIETSPGHPIAYLARGHCLMAAGQYTAAGASLRQGVEILPSWPSTPIGMRSLQTKPEVLARRTSGLEAAIQEAPEEASLHFLLGYVRFWEGQRAPARASFQMALKLEPAHVAAQAFLTELGDPSVEEFAGEPAAPQDPASEVQSPGGWLGP